MSKEQHTSSLKIKQDSAHRQIRCFILLLCLALFASGCAGKLQTKISGHLNDLERNQVVAILPPELTGDGQQGMSAMFRQSLHANLKHARFELMERYVVDSLLKQNKMTRPADYKKISPLKLGEVLGADAVVITRINRVQRTYLVLHSSIEVDISIEMIDTRSGEILWRADQTETDFQGIGKIPTGMSSAVLAPIQFVTNKLNLHRITHEMVTKLTNLVKRPERAEESQTFKKRVIAKTARRDLKRIASRGKSSGSKTKMASFTKKNKKRSVSKQSRNPSRKSKTGRKSQRARKPSGKIFLKHEPLWDEMEMGDTKETVAHFGAKSGAQVASFPSGSPSPITVSTYNPPASSEKRAVQASHRVRVASAQKPASKTLSPVQAGAYPTKEDAKQMMDWLLAKGHNAFVSWFKQDGLSVYRVHVDRFKDKQSALRASRALNAKENLTTVVTTVNPK